MNNVNLNLFKGRYKRLWINRNNNSWEEINNEPLLFLDEISVGQTLKAEVEYNYKVLEIEIENNECHVYVKTEWI